MAEIVGLVAASGQFLEESIKIVKLSKALYDKVQDAPEEIELWRSQISSLQELVTDVRDSPTLHTAQINATIEDCQKVGNRLCQIFDRLDFDTTDPLSRKTWRAIRGLANEDEIRDLFSQIEHLKTTLIAQMTVAQGNLNTMRLGGLESGIEDIKRSIEPGSEEDKCIRALFVTDAIADRARIITKRGKRTPKTCEWITSSPEYREWEQAEPDLLWISGPPGKGKTFLSIFLSEHLERSFQKPGSSVIYFFCDNQVSTRNTAVSILRGLMYQLIQRHGHLLNILLGPWKVQQDGLFKDASFETLWRIFHEMLMALEHTPTYCVLDALDECEPESLSALLSKFDSLFEPITSAKHGLKLLILSRRHPVCLPSTLSGFPHIQLDSTHHDVEVYISYRVSQLAAKVKIDYLLLEHIKTVFRERAEGTFLWVSLMAEELESRTLGELEAALEDLPRGLYSIYERILLQIKSTDQEVIAKMLCWVTLAMKPLSTEDMCEAIQIEGTDYLSREQVCESYVQSCGHLLQLSWAVVENPSSRRRGRIISFVHQSAKDFLLAPHQNPTIKKYLVNAKHGQTFISNALIQRLRTASRRDPFTEYAICHFHEHLRALDDDVLKVVRENPDFFSKKTEGKEIWAKVYFCTDTFNRTRLSWLHFASASGLCCLLEHLLGKKRPLTYLGLNTDVNKQDLNHLETPLHLACQSEHLKAVGQLLRHGADSNVPNKSQETPLHLACRVGNANIVELLLRYGADPGLPAHGQTSFHVAIRPDNDDIFGQLARSERGQQVFLKRPRPKGVRLSNLLPMAAEYGLEDACTVLIEQFGYDVNSKPDDHALEEAILGGHLELARKFVRQWNAKINPVKVVECCYLYGARPATPRHRFRQLLAMAINDWGVDINARNENGSTALHRLCSGGGSKPASSVMEDCLSFGANPVLVNQMGNTPLQSLFGAPGFPDSACFRVLLEGGRLNVNQLTHKGGTILHVFMEALGKQTLYHRDSPSEIVKLALDFGVDRYIRDDSGNTASDLIPRTLCYSNSREDENVIECEKLREVFENYAIS